MDNTINGRTHEEIKKGLECCALGECDNGCPYFEKMLKCTDKNMDALTLINQLLEDNQQLERERDAAVEAVGKLADNCDRSIACEYCEFRDHPCFVCEFKWRGVQEVEHGTE